MLVETFFWFLYTSFVTAQINREAIVRQYDPQRTASSNSTPLQVGNGNFAFGADITGLQTFLPYNTLSTWAWHNSSLPTTPNQTEPSDFTGLDWWTHDRLVNYDQPNPAEADISQWMISNPQRVNLGRIGLWFAGDNVTEADLEEPLQILDMYRGIITSTFVWDGQDVLVETAADPGSTTLAVTIKSQLLAQGKLGLFFDYPYMTDVNKFEAPFVGVWNATANHTTEMQMQSQQQARIQHDEDAKTYYTTIHWGGKACLTRVSPDSHEYVLQPEGELSELSFTASYHSNDLPEERAFYSPDGEGTRINTNATGIFVSSAAYWRDFWQSGAFVDLSQSNNDSATELQRRIIQSRYLLAVNEAGFDPPQESGLTNNGWYGKFHAEMFAWHLGHWGLWGQWKLLSRAMPGVYERFLPTSIERARLQGYEGARWGKESDPTGRSAPGEINSLLIWQQPHAMQFAEYTWRAFPNTTTLRTWDEVITQTADFMADYAWWNTSTGVYDLGPPMYPVSENTDPNSTVNPTFELAYWRLGLDIAAKWKQRQNLTVPEKWIHVASNLAKLPVDDGTYPIYEGIPDMWSTTAYDEDHPSMLGIYGWLPAPPTEAGFNLTIYEATVEHVYQTWNFTYSYGWDFPLLAMTATRLGDDEAAVGFLLDENFTFDDAGYVIGGSRVSTPYFPGASSMLWAVALMAGGWDGSEGGHWPKDWKVEAEGFLPLM